MIPANPAAPAPGVRAIFFDIGNVVLKLRTGHFLAELAAACDPVWTPESLLAVLREREGPHADYETGRINGEAFHAHLRSRFGLNLGYPAWVRMWNHYFEPNRPMEALLARLRGQARFFALSNTNAEHLSHMRMNFRVLDAFEAVIASNKPDAAIFGAALKKAGVPPSAVLYIDDVPEFVESGRALGLRGFHYTYNDEELRGVLLELGFQLPALDGRSHSMFC